MKDHIAELLAQALDRLRGDVLPDDTTIPPLSVGRTRDERHGDLSSNVALVLAGQAGVKPRELAERIVRNLPSSAQVARVEIAGPGFINFHLTRDAVHAVVRDILAAGANYGKSASGTGRHVLIEFVSANPTGPLHVGHGRLAAYGASVANLLEAIGCEVSREYYVNDAGRQMDILAASVWLRYLEHHGADIAFPCNGYKGEYVRDIAAALAAAEGDRYLREPGAVFADLPPDAPQGDKEAHIDALIDKARELLGDDYYPIQNEALRVISDDIREDLAEFGVTFDRWFSESALKERMVTHALEKLETSGHVFERDGALWLRSTDFGDDKDRVVVRDNGQTTYIASDIAYHLNKRERGHDLLLDVLGADHHGYVARVRAGLAAMGEPPECLEVRLMQFVALFRGTEKVSMSTRGGDFVTLRELREEVGNDAARLYYVMRSNDQHLDFDLELAKSRSTENPVYYLQYAHARVCSVFRKLVERGYAPWVGDDGVDRLETLVEPEEHALMATLARFPDIVETAAGRRAPQLVVNYLRELAAELNGYYERHHWIVDDDALRNGRLALIEATRQVLENGLQLVGVSAPASM